MTGAYVLAGELNNAAGDYEGGFRCYEEHLKFRARLPADETGR